MNSYELDSWQRVIRAHFLKIYDISKGNSLAITDHYTYLLPGILGIPKDIAFKKVLECANDPIQGTFNPDPLISSILKTFNEKSNLGFSELVFVKEFKNDFKSFIQKAEGNKSIIEVWVGASAILALISIFYVQYDDYIVSFFNNEETKCKANELAIKYVNIKRLLIAWRHEGVITIDIFSNLHLKPQLSSKARFLFLEAFQFMIYHELGHHYLNHLENTSKDNLTKEIEADSFALTLINDPHNIGPLICYLGSSILNFDDGGEKSAKPTDLKIRANNYYNKLEELSTNREETRNWIDQNLLPFQQVLHNLNNRLGLPSWYDEALNLLSKEIETAKGIVYKNDYYFNDIYKFTISSKPLPLKRTIDFNLF